MHSLNALPSIIPASLLLIPLLFTGYETPATNYQQVQLEGLTITITIERRSPRIEKADWPDESVSLVAESVPVSGKTIHELLKSAHIFPDVEAFAVVYALNPEMPELRELNISQIRIPKIRAGSKLEEAFTPLQRRQR